MSTDTTTPAAKLSEAMLRRVQGLLAKASDPAATPEESATYMAKATELMAKYGIERAMIDAAKPAGQREQVTHRDVRVGKPDTTDRRNLLIWLAKAMHCRGIYHTSTDRVTLFGFPSDLDAVEMLYASLLLQATRDMLKARVSPWENVAQFRRTFLVGFNSVVYRRVEALYQRVEADAERSSTPGTALVFAGRTEQVEQFMKEMFPKTRKGRTRHLTGGGAQAGKESGRRADIGQPAAGGGRQSLGGRS